MFGGVLGSYRAQKAKRTKGHTATVWHTPIFLGSRLNIYFILDIFCLKPLFNFVITN